MNIGGRIKQGIKILVLVLVFRPFVWFFLGLNRYSRLNIPDSGPCILAPNHNSHLDTILLLGLLPLRVAARTSFVAAGDYFYNIPVLSWFLFELFDMVPVWRKPPGGGKRPDPIAAMAKVLSEGRILALFPEGTRGLPEQRVGLKRGIAKVAARFPEVPVFPIYLRGLGKSLPRGKMVFVPLIPQVVLGEPLKSVGRTEEALMEDLARAYEGLEERVSKKDWMPT